MSGQQALGLIETRGLVAALEAADAAAKAASVRLAGIKKTVPALMTVQLVGETAAVRSAVDAGKAAAERVGTVVSTHVIPRPDADVARMQGLGDSVRSAQAPPQTRKTGGPTPKRKTSAGRPAPKAPSPRPATLDAPPPKPSAQGDLESMTVRELRALARQTEGLPIKGREIARANKAELLKAFGR